MGRNARQWSKTASVPSLSPVLSFLRYLGRFLPIFPFFFAEGACKSPGTACAFLVRRILSKTRRKSHSARKWLLGRFKKAASFR